MDHARADRTNSWTPLSYSMRSLHSLVSDVDEETQLNSIDEAIEQLKTYKDADIMLEDDFSRLNKALEDKREELEFQKNRQPATINFIQANKEKRSIGTKIKDKFKGMKQKRAEKKPLSSVKQDIIFLQISFISGIPL